jgi:hypothetical protein
MRQIILKTRCSPTGGSALVEDPTSELVREIKGVWNRNAIATLVEVGRLIVRSCYAGEIDHWRARGANHRVHCLERHAGLPFSRKTIHLALHFYDLSLRLPDPECLRELGIGHVRVVLGLRAQDQEDLLSQSRSNGWTIAELTEHASTLRRQSESRRGRPPTPEDVRVERRIRQHIEALEQLLSNVALAARFPDDCVSRVAASVAELKLHMRGSRFDGNPKAEARLTAPPQAVARRA